MNMFWRAVERDDGLAIRWYRRGAAEGSAQAKMRLVNLDFAQLAAGQHSFLVYFERKRLITEAARGGDPEGMYSMSLCSVPGGCSDGTIENKENGPECFRWLRLAADAGHIDAKKRLLSLYSEYSWVERQLRIGSDGGASDPELYLAYGRGTCLGKEIQEGIPLDVQCEEAANRFMHDLCLEQVNEDETCLRKVQGDEELEKSAIMLGFEQLSLLNSLWPADERADAVSSRQMYQENILGALCQRHGIDPYMVKETMVPSQLLAGILALVGQVRKEAVHSLAADMLSAERAAIQAIFARDDRLSPEVMMLLARWTQARREEHEGGKDCFQRARPYFIAAANRGHPTAIRWLKSYGCDDIISEIERALHRKMAEEASSSDSESEPSSASESERDDEEEGCESAAQRWINLYIQRLGAFLEKNPEYRENLAWEPQLLEQLPRLKDFLPSQQ